MPGKSISEFNDAVTLQDNDYFVLDRNLFTLKLSGGDIATRNQVRSLSASKIDKPTDSLFNGNILTYSNGTWISIDPGLSDINLKTNITPISNSLDKITKITGVEFEWNNNQSYYTGKDVGVIAQEVEEVLPEVVTLKEGGYKSVKYEKLVALLIEAVKELKTQVDELKK